MKFVKTKNFNEDFVFLNLASIVRIEVQRYLSEIEFIVPIDRIEDGHDLYIVHYDNKIYNDEYTDEQIIEANIEILDL